MIPETPLTVRDFDPNEMTLDEMIFLTAPQTLPQGELLAQFKEFMLAHGNWNAKEIGKIKAKELPEVLTRLGDALKSAAVPKETPPSSEGTPAAKDLSPTG